MYLLARFRLEGQRIWREVVLKRLGLDVWQVYGNIEDVLQDADAMAQAVTVNTSRN